MSSGSLPRGGREGGGGVFKLPESHTQSRGLFAIKLREREKKKKARQGPRINTSLSDSEHLRERMREGGNQRKPQRERVRETRKKERKKGGAEWNG